MEYQRGSWSVLESQMPGEHMQSNGQTRSGQQSWPHFIQRLFCSDRRVAATASIVYAVLLRVPLSHATCQISRCVQLDRHIQVNLNDFSLVAMNWQLLCNSRKDSTIVAPYEKWEYYDPRIKQMEQDRNYGQNKTKKVAWFVSNCGARNGRLNYAHELQKYIEVIWSAFKRLWHDIFSNFVYFFLINRSTYMDHVEHSNVHAIFQTNASIFLIVTINSIWHLRIQIARIT